MKKLLQMKFMLLLCALIVGSGTMWAEEETIASFSASVYNGGTTNEWTVTNADYATANSGYYKLISNDASIVTPNINWSDYKDITITISARKYGGPDATQGKISVSQGTTELASYSPSGTSIAASSALAITPADGTITISCPGASSSKGCGVQSIVIKGTKSSGGGDTPTTWTVTYDGNGASSGTVPVDNTEYNAQNNTVTVLGNTGSLAKEHYTFNNWNTADDGSGTGYVAGNTFTISGNTTLYAQWAINSHNVTLPAQNEFGVYTMSAVNPVAYGTEVTLTYNPASGYEKYVAAWSVNGTALEGNKFTMPDEAVTVTVSVAEKTTSDMTIDFENAASTYSDWTFTNIVSNYSNTGVNAHGGSKYGSTDGKASGSIQTKEKVNPASLTCYVSKQTTNTSTSTWYIHVSSDGSTWTEVANTDAKDMNKGEWKKFTAALSNYSDVYVRVSYSGSTAVRLIDDLTLEIKNDNRAEAGLAFAESSYSVELFNAASFTSPVLSNPNELSPITWTSSNETVATVNEGTVTILSEGETTIKASFDGDENYKKGEASYVLTVVDNRQTATVTWKDADGNNITELNVEKGDFIQGITLSCNVEGFTFTEKHLQHLWGTNETHDNYDGLQPAGYIFTPNAVWTAALGITTITATFPGNETHKPASATLTVNVTGGTETTPYTVAEAIAATPASGTSGNVYIKGIVSGFFNTSIVGDGTNYRYYISDNGTTTNQLLVYKGKGLNNTAFSSADDLQIGDVVTILGGLTTYNNAPEVASGNYIVSLIRKPAAPTFDPAAGTYTSTQYVTISAADGAAIYYTTDGTSPTTESNLYSEPIEVNTDMTIKAIAVKDSQISDVATAVYDIDLSPVITVASPIELDGNTPSKNITISYNNFTPGSDDFGVVYCDENGDELSGGYDWIEKITQWIDETPNTATMRFMFDPNTGSAPRTAYMKIYALNGSDYVYSNLITITQEVYVEPTKVSFYVNGGPIEYSYLEEGDPIVFPEVSDIDGMTFLGWTSTEINGTTDTAPEFVDVTSAKMGTESIDYYAVFALLVAPGTTSTVTDELTKALTGASGSSYSSWEGKKASSDAVYKGNSAGGYDAIQLRSNNNSGIVTTTSGGKLKKVTVEWNGNTANDRTLDIYGKNTAYAEASNLYGANTQGTKIGSIVYDGESTELTISGDYTFIGLRSNNGAMYLDKITIEWETGTPNTYSDYCTTIPAMLTVTIAEACTDGSKYYGTFSSSSAFKVPANVTVSEIGIDAEGKMNVQNYESGAVVPANTGVMVSATTSGNFKLIKSSEAGTSVLGDNNALRPTGDDGVSAADMEGNDSNCKFYRLTMHNGTDIGFWWGNENGTAFAVGSNKAYMAVPASVAGARNGFAFGDDATGISNVNINLNDNDNCYDLQGRKVNKPSKGLYIVNGKKVVIK